LPFFSKNLGRVGPKPQNTLQCPPKSLYKKDPSFKNTRKLFALPNKGEMKKQLLIALLLFACRPPEPKIVIKEAPCPEPIKQPATFTSPIVDPRPTPNPTPPKPAGVPAAINTTNVPVVSKEIRDRLLQYQNVRSASLQDVSQEGLLILTRFADTAQIHRVATPGGRREQLTFFDEPVSQAIHLWKSKQLFFTQAKGGDENNQLYTLNAQSGKAKLITDGKSRHELNALSHDEKYLAYSNNARNGKDMDLFLLDTAALTSEKLFDTKDESWSVADFTADNKKLLLSKFVSANEDYLYVYDRATQEKTAIPIPGGGKVSHGPSAFSPDGLGLFVTSNAENEFQRLAYVDLKTLSYKWITEKILWDVSGMAVSPASKNLLVAFSTNEDGVSKLYLLKRDLLGKFTYEKVETPLGVISGLQWYPAEEILAYTLSQPDAPSDVYTFEIKTKKQQRWTYSEVGGLDPKGFVTPSLIRYKSFDGQEIPAYVFEPTTKSDKRPPVIINIHGGPESQYQPLFSGLFQYWVKELGAVVIAPNVRGSSGYGKTYLAMDDVEKRMDSVKDIGALLDWIKNESDYDATRVAVYGGSYGGFMVLASLVEYGDKIKAGVDVVGIANFVSFLKNTSPYRVDLRRVEYGDERKEDIRAFLEKTAPANNADKIKSALMVVHGKNDPRVPFSEAQQIAEKVSKLGKPVWTVYADNEGHGFAKKENRDYLNAATTLFFQEFLLK
jgi:dipeptidyl aminopeptidase/acylaminoacyl peptidase